MQLPDDIKALGGTEAGFEEFKRQRALDAELKKLGGSYEGFQKFKAQREKERQLNGDYFGSKPQGIVGNLAKGSMNAVSNLASSVYTDIGEVEKMIPGFTGKVLSALVPADKLSKITKDEASKTKKDANTNLIGSIAYSTGQFAPSALIGEVAAPEALIGDSAKSITTLKDLLNSVKLNTPRNFLTGAAYGQSTEQNPLESGVLQSLLMPASDLILSMPLSKLQSVANKSNKKLIEVIGKYKDLLGGKMPSDLEASANKVYNGIVKNLKVYKDKASDLYKNAIKESDADGEKLKYSNFTNEATGMIGDIADDYGLPKIGKNLLDAEGLSSGDAEALSKLRIYSKRKPSTFEAADKLRQKLRKGKTSSDPMTREINSRLLNALDKDFSDSGKGKLWTDVRKQYKTYLDEIKENPISKYINSDKKDPDLLVNQIIKYSGNPDGLRKLITPNIQSDLEQKVIEQLGMNTAGEFSLNKALNAYQRMKKAQPKKTNSIFTKGTQAKLDNMLKDRSLNAKPYNLLSSTNLNPAYMKTISNDNAVRTLATALTAESLGHLMHVSGVGTLALGLIPLAGKKIASKISEMKAVSPETLVDIDDFLAQSKGKEAKANRNLLSEIGLGQFPRNLVIANIAESNQ